MSCNFYPRSPCGERRRARARSQPLRHFYPRSPCGERLCGRMRNERSCAISIHALLAESDAVSCVLSQYVANFYPRSPCGERPAAGALTGETAQFLSTLSLRRATRRYRWRCRNTGISIHALLAESDFFRPERLCYLAISIHALLAESDIKPVRDKRTLDQFLSTISLRRATFWLEPL